MPLRISNDDASFNVLFHNSPTPMWIVEVETLRFKEVNEAAIKHYGYSRHEFLKKISLANIRPVYEQQEMLDLIKRIKHKQTIKKDLTHIKKDGTAMHVNITSYNVNYYGSRCRMVIITDITNQKHGEEQINLKNESLDQIAYINSHMIRKPLANILGIINSLEGIPCNEDHMAQPIKMLKQSAIELDHIIKDINSRVEKTK